MFGRNLYIVVLCRKHQVVNKFTFLVMWLIYDQFRWSVETWSVMNEKFNITCNSVFNVNSICNGNSSLSLTISITYRDPHNFGKYASFNNSWLIFSQIIYVGLYMVDPPYF